jgi:FkbM family methyltransferase
VKFDAWVFPDREEHMPAWMTRVHDIVDGRLTYQYRKYERALAYCAHRRHAVDVGAHVGLWSYWMARDFAEVDAFEPWPEHADCWWQNVPARDGVRLHVSALGEQRREVGLHHDVLSTGNTRVTLQGGDVPMTTLDAYALTDVDLIKLDCEGFEYFVLQGGEATILRDRPVTIVEQKHGCAERFGRGNQDAVGWMTDRGARVQANLGGDFLMTFKAA